MDSIRSHPLIRHGLLAALVATGIYAAPSLFAADDALFGLNLFQHFSMLFTLVLMFAALRVSDRALRAKLALGVLVGFGLLAIAALDLSVVSLVLMVLAMAVSVLEWPQEAAKASTY